MLFLLPFAISRTRFVRRLSWLGSDLCDYNAPLLARGVSARLDAASFMLLWQRILQRLRREPHLQFDLIDLEKMPEQVGAQRNPMCWLRLSPHRSGAYLTPLGSDWTSFYKSKRSTQTRARDRNKRRKLAEIGEVQTVTPHTEAEIIRTLDALIQQKARFFARMGLHNIFERPGHMEFFRELASTPSALQLVHVSRLEVGDAIAAANLGLIFHGCYYHVLASFDDGELSRSARASRTSMTSCAMRSNADAACSTSPSAMSNISATGAMPGSTCTTTSGSGACAAPWLRSRWFPCANCSAGSSNRRYFGRHSAACGRAGVG
jgi:CelD/BcsL family acetyltransferase involved in cellulose biosynthesis